MRHVAVVHAADETSVEIRLAANVRQDRLALLGHVLVELRLQEEASSL